MSIAKFPRIYFKGGISWDPGLGNNDLEYTDEDNNLLAPSTYDEENAALRVPFNRTLEEHKKKYPQESGWNHFGTHSTKFENVMVTGVSSGPGIIITDDSLVGQVLLMEGKLVDSFPHFDHGTQVFFDQLLLGDDFTPGFRALRNKRMLMRYLNFSRNPTLAIAGRAGAVWEVCFRSADLKLSNTSLSPVLQELQAVLDDQETAGIAMRFHTYRTLYFRNGIDNRLPEQPREIGALRDLYADERNFSNPAYSIVLGVISPWTIGEPEGHPAGRMIMPSRPVPVHNLPLGPTFIETDRENSRFVLDLGETVPESDEAPTKINVGSIAVVANVDGREVNLATVEPDAYAQEDYEKFAGLVDIDVSGLSGTEWEAVQEGQLLLKIDGETIAQERDFVVVAEDREIYLDEGETKDIELKVFVRGAPAGEGVSVLVARYAKRYVRDSQGRRGLIFSYDATIDTLATDRVGQIVLSVSAIEPSLYTYVFYAYYGGQSAPEPDETFSKSGHFYVNVRTLPFDDELASTTTTPDSALTWQWIYENIFAVYDVVNPVMSRQENPRIGRPLHDRQTMENFVADIRRLIDKANFESADYMPVTRDLSNGKRLLLERWCDLVEQGDAPLMVARTDTKTSSSDPRV